MSGYGTKVPTIKGHRQGGCAFQRKIRDKSERKLVALSNIAISVKQERLSRIITGFKESVFAQSVQRELTMPVHLSLFLGTLMWLS